MKNFYVECSISYSDTCEGVVYVGVENYSMTLQANSRNIAEIMAKSEAMKLFDEEINENYSNITIAVNDCYETSDDARSS